MREVEMAATTTGTTFHRHRHTIVLPFEALQAGVATVLGIDIKHNDRRDTTGHNSDPRLRPTRQPGLHFLNTGSSVLKFFPAYEWAFIATSDRKDRPAAFGVVLNRLADRNISVH
jgi:hypothetical protein